MLGSCARLGSLHGWPCGEPNTLIRLRPGNLLLLQKRIVQQVPTLAIAATGTQLTFDGQPVPEVTNISDLGGQATLIDVTSHDVADHWSSRIPTFLDGGTVRVDMNFVPSNTVHAAMYAAFLARESKPCVVTLPDAGSATFTFSAFVTEFRLPTLPVNGVLAARVGLTTDGQILFAA